MSKDFNLKKIGLIMTIVTYILITFNTIVWLNQLSLYYGTEYNILKLVGMDILIFSIIYLACAQEMKVHSIFRYRNIYKGPFLGFLYIFYVTLNGTLGWLYIFLGMGYALIFIGNINEYKLKKEHMKLEQKN